MRKLALLHESSPNTEQSGTETKYNCRLEESERRSGENEKVLLLGIVTEKRQRRVKPRELD